MKIFDRMLSASIEALVAAIDWAAHHRMHAANLSLGTPRIEHEAVLRVAVARAAAYGLIVVSARVNEGVRYWPGSLPGVLPVEVDWACPRDEYRLVRREGRGVFRASGFPREIPGVPAVRNLHGISFAVANMTGFVARALEGVAAGERAFPAVVRALRTAYMSSRGEAAEGDER